MANQTQYPATSHANSMTTDTDLSFVGLVFYGEEGSQADVVGLGSDRKFLWEKGDPRSVYWASGWIGSFYKGDELKSKGPQYWVLEKVRWSDRQFLWAQA